MKLKYTLFALLGLVGTACSNQELEEGSVDAGQVQVTAGIAKSRVSFSEADNMTNAYWQNGDAITLNTPTQGNLNYTATVSEDDATMAAFVPEDGSLKDIDGETVYACYPAAAITDGVVALPATDKWTDEKPLPFAYAISSISASKVNLSFDHTFAFLKLTLSAQALKNATSTDGEKTVHRLSVKSASGSLGIVSGTFNFEDKSVSITEGSDEVVFTLSKAFNPLEETERSVYIPVLPQEGNVAITISLLHDYEGGEDVLLEMEKQTPADGLVKGYVYDLTLTGNSSAVIEGDSGEIHLAVAGTLSNYITDENKFTIKSLKISGYLNGIDIKLLREMAGRDWYDDETDGKLISLDVSEATVVGGDNYANWRKAEDNVWGDFFARTNLATVELPKNIISIDSSAFEDCNFLISVVIPDNVISIGTYAFESCESLTSVTLGKSVTEIGSSAFYNSQSLVSVTIPEDAALTTIESWAFGECRALQQMVLPESLTFIGSCAFCRCTSLVSINIPDAVTTISEHAFSGCSSLARCSMGNGVTSIGQRAFEDCFALVAITIPEGITSIEEGIFLDCSSLQTIVIPDGVITIGTSAFSGCTSLKNVTIGKGVTSIGDTAFHACAFSNIEIPDNVVSIGVCAFQYSKLVSISIGNGVEEIGTEAFFNCSSLKSITIPESVTYMGYDVFGRCYSLTEAYNVLVDNYSTSGIGMFCGAPLQKVTINEKSTRIAPDTFWDCGTLPEIVIPENITEIGNSAFQYCKSLKNITIPNSVVTIGTDAFASCEALESATLPNNIMKVSAQMFQYCEALKEIVIPDAVITIDRSAFRRCYALDKVTLGKNVTSMGTDTFEDCPISECISYSATAPVVQNTTFTAINKETAKLYVPKGSLTAYQESDWATYFGNIIEMEE